MARELDQRFTLEAVKRARRTRSPERDQPVQQSDFVENAEIIAHWEASPNFLGVALPVDLLETEPSELEIVRPCLQASTLSQTPSSLSGSLRIRLRSYHKSRRSTTCPPHTAALANADSGPPMAQIPRLS